MKLLRRYIVPVVLTLRLSTGLTTFHTMVRSTRSTSGSGRTIASAAKKDLPPPASAAASKPKAKKATAVTKAAKAPTKKASQTGVTTTISIKDVAPAPTVVTIEACKQ